MADVFSQLRISDPVLTTVVHGYAQADSIAPFVAPVVPVPVRAGKIVKFTKEHFAVVSTRRTPGATIKRVSTDYTSDSYVLNQHAVGAEVTEEAYQEAINGEAKVDLRANAALRATGVIDQSWEQEVVDTITDASTYEPTNVVVATGSQKFTDPLSDPESFLMDLQEIVRSQVGVYANSLLIDPKTFIALRKVPIFRDRVKYTSSASITLDMIAAWLNLPGGIRIAQRVKLAADGTLVNFMAPGTAVLFYNPANGSSADGYQGATFKPVPGADKAVPNAWYTYTLGGYPIAGKERFDEDRRVYVTDVIAEQSVLGVGLGVTGKIGAAVLITGLVA